MRRIAIVMIVAAVGGLGGRAVQAQESTPPIRDAASVETQPEPDAAATDPQLKDVMAEVAKLRDEVLRMQQTLDMFMNGTVADLQIENERLRKEIRDLSLERKQALPPVPMPDKALLEGLYEDSKRPTQRETPAEPDAGATPETPRADEGDREAAKKPAPPVEFTHETVAEWGRTPEEASASGPKTASLKGMIIVVPEGSATEDLVALGRELRNKHDAYDNINIEVFDQREAAETFKGRNVVSSAHRVLSISKHAASGRDKIVLLQGDQPTEVPREP